MRILVVRKNGPCGDLLQLFVGDVADSPLLIADKLQFRIRQLRLPKLLQAL